MRLDALGINPFEAERRAQLKRGYVNDLLIGKKSTFREKALPAIAAALECDPDFLTGRLDTPRPAAPPPPAGVPIAGIAEAGAWRDPSAGGDDAETLPVTPDPRFDPDKQAIFLVRGDHAGGLGISGGSVVIVLAGGGPYRSGDVVVGRRTAGDGTVEASVRVLAAGALSARPLRGEIPPYPLDEAEIIGRVVSAIRVFGDPH